MKYKTLKDLKKAFDTGEISKDFPLVLDNDCSFVCIEEQEVYSGGGPSELLVEALDLLGIPWENC